MKTVVVLLAGVALAGCAGAGGMQTPDLFVTLPDFCPTPDGMAVHPQGDLVVACPNYADQTKPACLIRIDKDRKVSKWVDVPVLPETGVACPMGVEFGPDGDLYVCDNQGWKGTPQGQFKGRILRLRIQGNAVVKTTVVAEGMEHPNGVRVRDGYAYVTQSLMTKVKDPSGLLVSAVYRFRLDDANVRVANTLSDGNIVVTLVTRNKACQYGADGLVFDAAGNLYVGNFGDGAIHKVTFGPDGKVSANVVWAQDLPRMRTTDGICMDAKGHLYVADFSENAVAVVSPAGKVRRIAQSPDSDGRCGELDQPGEPILWNGMLVVTNFDCVTGPDKINTKHDRPFTMSALAPE
jgi:sugar lactone lactonase YvrE